jgi:AGCS family alanine or glycine:cation symporter
MFFSALAAVDKVLWEYVCLILILGVGVFFTLKSKFFQIINFFMAAKNIKALRADAKDSTEGVNPIKLYFASVGGMIGLGNISAVAITVMVGGPGSVFWMWIASFLGMIVKYAEIYLGVKYRVKNNKNGYDGGPMYYIGAAFESRILAVLVALLLCVYGTEVFQFLTITDTFVHTFGFDRAWAIAGLLLLVMVSAVGGVHRLANICSALMPPFMLSYVILGIYVICDNSDMLPEVWQLIWHSAFHGTAPVAGFAGSSMLMAMHRGFQQAVYSGDIGIGYDATIQSETRAKNPGLQARLAIISLFTDTFVCTISLLVILVTGVWSTSGMIPSQMVPNALTNYVPNIQYVFGVLMFLAGFSTIVGYLVVGQKCASFIHKKYGRYVYLAYSVFAFIVFSFFDQTEVMLVMSVSGGLIIVLNLLSLFRLRNHITFKG